MPDRLVPVLGFLIVLAAALGMGYAVVALILFQPDISLWTESQRAFWLLIVGIVMAFWASSVESRGQ